MPGLIIHHWSAVQSLDIPGFVPGCIGPFFFGSLAPDLGYWPGGKHLWSDLSHYIGSTTLAHVMMELSNTEAWRSFSLGWLLHIYMDVYGHPVINHIAASHHSDISDMNAVLTYEDNPVAHIRVESGLDLAALMKLDISGSNYRKLCFPGEVTPNCPLVQAFRLCYGQDLDLEALSRLVARVPDLHENFIKWQTRLAQLRVNTLIGRTIDRSIRLILAQVLRLSLGKKQGGHAAAMVRPDWPIETEFTDFFTAIQAGIRNWKEIVTGIEPWPEKDFNLDTGKRSRRGDYGLADNTMDYLVEVNSSEKIRERFGADASSMRKWEKIRMHFDEPG